MLKIPGMMAVTIFEDPRLEGSSVKN